MILKHFTMQNLIVFYAVIPTIGTVNILDVIFMHMIDEKKNNGLA